MESNLELVRAGVRGDGPTIEGAPGSSRNGKGGNTGAYHLRGHECPSWGHWQRWKMEYQRKWILSKQ